MCVFCFCNIHFAKLHKFSNILKYFNANVAVSNIFLYFCNKFLQITSKFNIKNI